jgi:hypothetical protein
MGFSFYPLRRLQKVFTSARVSRIIFYFHLVLRSLILRGWEHGLHAARSSRLVDAFLLLDLQTFSFPQLSSFLPPSSWRSPFDFQRYHTVAKLLLSKPLSTPWHFTCQLLFVVAKAIYSASVLLLWRIRRFRHLSFSFYFHLSDLTFRYRSFLLLFYAFFPQRLAFTSNRCTSHAAQKPDALLLTPSSRPALFIKTCSARCFLSPPLSSFSMLGLPSEPDNLNLYRRSGHLTCPLSIPFSAVKPSLPFLRFLSSLSPLISVSPGRLSFLNFPSVNFACGQSQSSGPTSSCSSIVSQD